MGDLAAVALAVAAGAGAWAARPLPLLPVALLVALALLGRRPVLLMIGVALAASGLGFRAWDGLRPPALGQWSGVATLVGDPASVAGALRVDVRIGGKRVEAWARGSAARALRDRLAGERVHLRGELQPVPEPARDRLARRHVAARLTVAGASVAPGAGIPSRLANGLRRTLLRGVEVLPPERRALFAGFVLGDDRDQRPEVTDDFRASGLSHLLVVSGQNVAFVLALLGPFLHRLRLGGRLAGGVAALALFGILTRWEPSVLRAVAMAGLALLAGAMGRSASSLRILSLAVTGLVLVDPLLVRSLGFLLSVGACAGIALFSTRLAARLPGPRPLATALGVTLAAQVGVVPVLVPVFGGLPVAALPANLLGAPVAGPLMMWGMAAGLVAGWAPAVAGIVHVPTDLMIRWVAGVAHWGAAVPLGQMRAGHVAGVAVALVVGGAAYHRRWRGGVVAAGLAGAAVALAPAFAVLRPSGVDGRLVVAGARLWRHGGASVLVVDDLRASPQALLSSLHRADVRRLDVLVVSRPGTAAASDVDALRRRFPPRLVLAPARHRLPGEVVVPAAGSEVGAGGLVVRVVEATPRLTVEVASTRAAGARAAPGERARAPPDSVDGRMRLTVGPHTYDLTTRALVMGVHGLPKSLAEEGADIVEHADPDPRAPVPVCVVAGGDDAVRRALSAGAVLVRMPAPSDDALRRCAAAGAAVIVPSHAADRAKVAGVPPDRVVPETLLLDVTAEAYPVPVTAVGVIRGGRIVRTADVRGARRVCDVLAAVLEAR